MSEYDPFSKVARQARHRSAIIGLTLIAVGLVVIYAMPLLSPTRLAAPNIHTDKKAAATSLPTPDEAFNQERSRTPRATATPLASAINGEIDRTPAPLPYVMNESAEAHARQGDGSQPESASIAPRPETRDKHVPSLATPEEVETIGPSIIQKAVPVGVDEVPAAQSIDPYATAESVPIPGRDWAKKPGDVLAQAAVQVPYRHSAIPVISLESGLVSLCEMLAARVNTTSKKLCPAGRTLRLGHTGMNRPVMGQILKERDNAPRVMVLAGVAGDQQAGVDTVLHWLDDLATIKEISWLVVPAVNPDGLLASPPHSSNAHGVTLARNLPTVGWEHTARLAQPTSLRASRQNPGIQGGSESEIAAVIASIAAFSPDLILEIGGGDGLVTFHGSGDLSDNWAPLLIGYEPYSPGSLAQYASGERAIDVLDISLPSTHSAPVRATRIKILDHVQQFIHARYVEQTHS